MLPVMGGRWLGRGEQVLWRGSLAEILVLVSTSLPRMVSRMTRGVLACHQLCHPVDYLSVVEQKAKMHHHQKKKSGTIFFFPRRHLEKRWPIFLVASMGLDNTCYFDFLNISQISDISSHDHCLGLSSHPLIPAQTPVKLPSRCAPCIRSLHPKTEVSCYKAVSNSTTGRDTLVLTPFTGSP